MSNDFLNRLFQRVTTAFVITLAVPFIWVFLMISILGGYTVDQVRNALDKTPKE